MDASLSAQSALICFTSCSDDDIATALRTRTDLRNRLHDLIAVSFQDPADAPQTASASANWPDSHHPATPAPHAVFGGKPTSQSNKGAGRKSTSSQGKGPSDYAPQSRPRPSWHDMSHDPQAQDSNWDQTHYTAPRQQEHDPWQQASNPRRNAYREPWPPGSPLAQRPDWNAPQAQQSRSPPASDQGGEDLPLVPSKHIAPHLIEWCGTRPYFIRTVAIIGHAHTHAHAPRAGMGAPHATLRPMMSRRTCVFRTPAVCVQGRRQRRQGQVAPHASTALAPARCEKKSLAVRLPSFRMHLSWGSFFMPCSPRCSTSSAPSSASHSPALPSVCALVCPPAFALRPQLCFQDGTCQQAPLGRSSPQLP